MIDCYGNRVVVSWSEVEMLWLDAALSLETRKERTAAYRDIASMSGRPFTAVQSMAWRVAMLRRDQGLQRQREIPRQVKRVEPMAPSFIRRPTPAQMMIGRATYSPTTGMR